MYDVRVRCSYLSQATPGRQACGPVVRPDGRAAGRRTTPSTRLDAASTRRPLAGALPPLRAGARRHPPPALRFASCPRPHCAGGRGLRPPRPPGLGAGLRPLLGAARGCRPRLPPGPALPLRGASPPASPAPRPRSLARGALPPPTAAPPGGGKAPAAPACARCRYVA